MIKEKIKKKMIELSRTCLRRGRVGTPGGGAAPPPHHLVIVILILGCAGGRDGAPGKAGLVVSWGGGCNAAL